MSALSSDQETTPGDTLLAWLASLPAAARDPAFDAHLGLEQPFASADVPPGAQLIGYHASGIAPIVRALLEVPVTSQDVFIDIGSGLGKVTFLARLLTGATARGIEIQPSLVLQARAAAQRLGVAVEYIECDARAAKLDDGTVFYLYAPVHGVALNELLARLHGVARQHAIVVCALGIDLDHGDAAPWLIARNIESFWLAVYDSVVPGVPARVSTPGSWAGEDAKVVGFEAPVKRA